MASSSSSAAAEAAERLRLEGNDAFGTKDWERAVELYQQSVQNAENEKTYSNLAATLCKLGRYEEAAIAAERATVASATWAKGWWRRGVVAELRKLFFDALKFFTMATDLEPNEQTFKRALQAVKMRLKAEEGPNGAFVVESVSARANDNSSPGLVAWMRARELTGNGSDFMMLSKYATRQDTNNPTSEQWLVFGLNGYVWGLKTSMANVCRSFSRDAAVQLQQLQQQRPMYHVPDRRSIHYSHGRPNRRPPR
jgi:tetratricopeptide (TPR) repeat protein